MKITNKLWTKLCQAQGRNYVSISLVIENLDPKLLYKQKDKHVKIQINSSTDQTFDGKINRLKDQKLDQHIKRE